MRFEERELKPYAEPISATELQEGSVYFSVTFADDDMRIPIVETLVFVGRNEEGFLRFQDAESHYHGVRTDAAAIDDHARIYECSQEQVANIFEYERALDQLMRCSMRRQGRK